MLPSSIKVGFCYRSAHGDATRIVERIVDSVVYYRLKGVLSLAPFKADKSDFARWADVIVPSESSKTPTP